MMALNLTKSCLINRLCSVTLNQTQLVNHLSTVTIKVDGKPINIDDLPKKPKSPNLFEKYCEELGVTEDQLKNQRNELRKSFNENKESILAKNKNLIEKYQIEQKAYREAFKKTIKLKDAQDLIKFYQKQAEKEAQKEAKKKQRKTSFWQFYVKQALKDGLGKDLTEVANKFKTLSSSQIDHYKRLHEDYLRQNY